MNNYYRDERRDSDETTKRTAHDIDRFEDEGGAGPEGTRHQQHDGPPVVRKGIVQLELPLPAASPRSDGKDMRMEPAEGAQMAADPSQVIVTAGATADSAQVHHRGIPELQSHGKSPESAVSNLAQVLTREIDGAPDDLHREPLQRALDDVEASIERRA